MMLLKNCKCLIFLLILLLPAVYSCYSQCSPQKGPPPSNQIFNTGSNGIGGVLQPTKNDLHWTVATDSINGVYDPAIVMDSLPPDYYKSPWPDCRWISISRNGNHSHDRQFFYKMDFNLPCENPCGDSYNKPNTFCLTLDILADNSVYEIYVNGVAQSGRLGGIIPAKPDPYHATGLNLDGMISVSLCSNWKAGANTVIIEVVSSAPVTGLLTQASTVYTKPISSSATASICNGETFAFGTQTLDHAGLFYETYKTVSGCDSTVALQLQMKPAFSTTIDTTICEGQSYLGHTVSGAYADTFKAVNGCDSISIINLLVTAKPNPAFSGNGILCKGGLLTLNPGKFSSYLWLDNSTEDHYTVKTSGVYSVIVTGTCGTGIAQINIIEKDCDIYFPNAFTPNGDGRNDYFKVLTSYIFQDYWLVVFNRFGQKVFETKNSLEGWDGKINGVPQQSGVFPWKCRYKKADVFTDTHGIVTLLR